MSEKSKSSADPFLLDTIYPNAGEAFFFKPLSLDQIKDRCLVFLDTNVLLLPYSTGKESLENITAIYKNLADSKRLYIPKRVIQEFESNAPEKLKEMFLKINQAQAGINFTPLEIPLLGVLEENSELRSATTDLQESISSYRNNLNKTIKIIREWHHDDPVKKLYRSIFDHHQIITTTRASKEILDDLNYRWANKIPPGFQDSGKDDQGIGDLLIWLTILEKCTSAGAHAIFVTGDAKNDWWHVSNKTPLYARRELVEEFRSKTGGNTIRLLSATEFFKLYGASDSVVSEIKKNEAAENYTESFITLGESRAIVRWIQANFDPGSTVESLDSVSGFANCLMKDSSGRPFAVRMGKAKTLGSLTGRINASIDQLPLELNGMDHLFLIADDDATIKMALNIINFSPLAKKMHIHLGPCLDGEIFEAITIQPALP